jgi:mxaJ protein
MSSVSEMVRTAAGDCLIVAIASALLAGGVHAASAWRQPAEPGHLVVASSEPSPSPPSPDVLRVCADPNNLPFSNDARQGFENVLAELVARDLGKRVSYYWQPQRRGFMRTTLNAGWCDVVMGVPASFNAARPTRPYYRSAYVFVWRRGRAPIHSLDDPRLRHLRIGVEMTGEDYDNPPAVQALASRHIIDNMRGYLVYGDYSMPDPPRRVVDAVANGEVDTAIAWGPLAGYFAARSTVPLDMAPIVPERDGGGLLFAFDIAMAVRRSDRSLHDALDRVIARRQREIADVLVGYGVPLMRLKAVP